MESFGLLLLSMIVNGDMLKLEGARRCGVIGFAPAAEVLYGRANLLRYIRLNVLHLQPYVMNKESLTHALLG